MTPEELAERTTKLDMLWIGYNIQSIAHSLGIIAYCQAAAHWPDFQTDDLTGAAFTRRESRYENMDFREVED